MFKESRWVRRALSIVISSAMLITQGSFATLAEEAEVVGDESVTVMDEQEEAVETGDAGGSGQTEELSDEVVSEDMDDGSTFEETVEEEKTEVGGIEEEVVLDVDDADSVSEDADTPGLDIEEDLLGAADATAAVTGLYNVRVPSYTDTTSGDKDQSSGYLYNTYNTGYVSAYCIWLGRYWQEDTNGDGVADKNDEKTPIKWRVLLKPSGKYCLLADKSLAFMGDDDESLGTGDAINTWLNNEFYNDAFNDEEKKIFNTLSTGGKVSLVGSSVLDQTAYSSQHFYRDDPTVDYDALYPPKSKKSLFWDQDYAKYPNDMVYGDYKRQFSYYPQLDGGASQKALEDISGMTSQLSSHIEEGWWMLDSGSSYPSKLIHVTPGSLKIGYYKWDPDPDNSDAKRYYWHKYKKDVITGFYWPCPVSMGRTRAQIESDYTKDDVSLGYIKTNIYVDATGYNGGFGASGVRPYVEVKTSYDSTSDEGYKAFTKWVSYAGQVTGAGSYDAESYGPYNLANCEVTVDPTSYIYDGTGKTPTVTVKNILGVVDSSKYRVIYDNNVRPGTATATVSPAVGSPYYGSKSVTFTITENVVSVGNFTVSLSQDTYEYDTTEHRPSVTVKDGNNVIGSGYYTVSYSNNVNPGTATVTVTGNGKTYNDPVYGRVTYTGAVTKTFTIEKGDIANGSVVLYETGTKAYTGSAVTPAIKVMHYGMLLKEGTDYTVSYKNNVNPGTATVTVTGKGNYTGTNSNTFVIVATGMAAASVNLSNTVYMYDGTAKTPAVTVVAGNTILREGTDYTVAYKDNINIGKASVTVTGKGEYTGSTVAYFYIIDGGGISMEDNRDLTLCTVTFDRGPYTYKGSAYTPAVTVKNGDNTLRSGTDYTVTYSNNIYPGLASITIKGAGEFTGTLKDGFRINVKDINLCMINFTANNATYSGTEVKGTVTVQDGTKMLEENTDYVVMYDNNVSAGSANVIIKGMGYYTGYEVIGFDIAKGDIGQCTITLSESIYTYDGTAKTPSVTVKSTGNKTMKEGKEYNVAYESNINAGTGKAIITGTGNFTGSATKTFTINKIDLSECEIEYAKTGFAYTGAAITPTFTVKNGSIIIEASDGYTSSCANNVDAGNGTLTVTGTNNCTGTLSSTFKISGRSIRECTITLSSETYTYDGEEKKPSVVVKDFGKTLTEGTDYTVSYANNINAGKARCSVTGMGNYANTYNKAFTIEAVDLADCSILINPESYEYTGSAIEPGVRVYSPSGELITSDKGYEIEYTNNTNVGTAKVTLTGTGNVKGAAEQTFTITDKEEPDGMSVELLEDGFVFDNTEKKPAIRVKDSGRILTEGTDYLVVYQDNIHAGEASVIVTGLGDVKGTKVVSFTIAPLSIEDGLEDGRITVKSPSKIEISKCNSSASELVTVSSEYGMTKGSDYRVDPSIPANVSVGDPILFVITGLGDYTGTLNYRCYVIEDRKDDGSSSGSSSGGSSSSSSDKDDSSSSSQPPEEDEKTLANCEISFVPYSFTSDGEPKEPEVIVKHKTKTLKKDVDYEVEYVNNINAGLGTAIIKGKGEYSGIAILTFEIDGTKLSACEFTLDKTTYTYTGEEIEPNVTVTLKNKTVGPENYRVTYENNVEAGKGKVVIKGNGDYVGTKKITFVIAPASLPLAVSDGLISVSYPDTINEEEYNADTVKGLFNASSDTLIEGVDYNITVKTPTDVVDGARVYYYLNGTGNYSGKVMYLSTIIGKSDEEDDDPDNKDSSSSSSKEGEEGGDKDKDFSSSAGGKSDDSSSSSKDGGKDGGSSTKPGGKSSSSSSTVKIPATPTPGKDDTKDSSSSSSKSGEGSGSEDGKDEKNEKEHDGLSEMPVITLPEGNVLTVGDRARLDIEGVDASRITAKGKVGIFSGGVFTALKKGTIKLYMPGVDGKDTLICKIKVVSPKLKSAYKVNVGSTKALKLTKGEGLTVIWSSFNPEIATVDPQSGVVTGVKSGKARIVALTQAYPNNHKYITTVTVK